jgi:hypothetical protein
MNSESEGAAVWSSCYFQVTNDRDEVLLEFPFTEAVEIKSQPN